MLDALAAIAQALLYGGVLFGAGGVLASATLRPNVDVAETLRRTVRRGAWLTIAATLFGLALLVLRLGDSLDATILQAVLMSNVGGAAALRLSGATLLLVTPSVEEDEFGRGMHLTAAVLVLAGFSFSGHAAADGIVSGLIAALHVGVAGWWMSSLVALRSASVGATPDALALVARFSALAVFAITLLIVAGGVLIAVLIDFSPFVFTPYARNLSIKLLVVALVLGLAAYNRFALTARVLAGDSKALRTLQRAIEIEMWLIAAVLLATAIMTTYTSPHE
jgi:putative copper resistance protein D